MLKSVVLCALMQKMTKNDDEIIEAIPWIRPFIDVRKMNMHQEMVIFFLKNDESIL